MALSMGKKIAYLAVEKFCRNLSKIELSREGGFREERKKGVSVLKGKQKCVLMCACVCLFVWCCSSPVQKNCSFFLNEWTIFLAIVRMFCNVAFTFTFLFFSILWSFIHLYVQVYFISRLGVLLIPLDAYVPTVPISTVAGCANILHSH